MHFMSMSARYMIDDALNVYVVEVVYAASCCSHEPCYNETAQCKNIKYSSLRRYRSLFDTSAYRGSLNDHSINILPWRSMQLKVRKPIIYITFQAFWLYFSSQNTKKLEAPIRWHTVDSRLVNSGIMKNGICPLFLQFSYWVTELWIRWPD